MNYDGEKQMVPWSGSIDMVRPSTINAMHFTKFPIQELLNAVQEAPMMKLSDK